MPSQLRFFPREVQYSSTAHSLHRSLVGRAQQDPESGKRDQYTGAMEGQFRGMKSRRGAQTQRRGTGGEFARGSTWEAGGKTDICFLCTCVLAQRWEWLLLGLLVQQEKPQLGTSLPIPKHLRGYQAEAKHTGALLSNSSPSLSRDAFRSHNEQGTAVCVPTLSFAEHRVLQDYMEHRTKKSYQTTHTGYVMNSPLNLKSKIPVLLW